MKGKNLIILLLMFSTVAALVFIKAVCAQNPRIYVTPSVVQIDIGEKITITIDIRDVANPGIFSFELKVRYNNTLLNAVNASYPSNYFLSEQSYRVPPEINNQQGYVLLAATKCGDVVGSTGSGVLAAIEFIGVAAGTSLIEVEYAILLDPEGNSLAYSVSGGNIEVIPEFAQLLSLTIYLLITVAIIITWKKFTVSRKQQVSLTKG